MSPEVAVEAQSIRDAMKDVPEVEMDAPDTTSEDVRRSIVSFGPFDSGNISVGRWSGRSPWELHADGDELLHVLEGEIEVTVLGETGPGETVLVPTGSIFVVPRARWHRTLARRALVFTLRASDHGPVSFAEDPRSGA